MSNRAPDARSSSLSLLIILLIPLAAQQVAAQTAPDEEIAPISLEERELPDYEGRGPEPVTARDVLLWIPRILASPLYLLTEYVLRRPLGYMVTQAEKHEVQAKVVQFFHFGPDGRFYLAPTFSFDLGFGPSVGIHFGVADAFAKGNNITAAYSFGGVEWHSASLADHYSWADGEWEVGIQGNFSKRTDGRFWGLGREVSEAANSGFDYTAVNGEVFIERQINEHGHARLDTGVRHQTFGDDARSGRDTIPEIRAQGIISELPPGYEEGYTAHFVGIDVAYDTRPIRPEPSSGMRLTAQSELAYNLRDGGPSEQMWLHYGGGIGGYLDVSGVNHILSLTLGVALVEGINGEVPFTEQPVLSGAGPMSGFLGNFLTGESAISATFSYSWPIWVYLDGIAHVSVGNVFDGRFDGFEFEKLRLSTGFGIAAVTQRDHFFELLVGFGTNTFTEGADIDSVRVTFGGRREF